MADMIARTPELLSYSEAAVRWHVSERTIARLVASGKVKAYTHSDDRRRRRVDADEVAAALGPAPGAEHAETTAAVAEVATTLLVAAVLGEKQAYKQVRDTLDADLLNTVAAVMGGVERLLDLDERADYPVERR